LEGAAMLAKTATFLIDTRVVLIALIGWRVVSTVRLFIAIDITLHDGMPLLFDILIDTSFLSPSDVPTAT